MDNFQYPNLTIIDEDMHTLPNIKAMQRFLIAKMPANRDRFITIHDIQKAAQEQYDTELNIHEISAVGSDFIFYAYPHSVTKNMLHTGFLQVFELRAQLKPWYPEYGCIKIPAWTQPPPSYEPEYSNIVHTMPKPLRRLQINIKGLPAHLCTDNTVIALLKNRCIINSIQFDITDYTYSVCAHAHTITMIPDMAHLGLRKTEHNRTMLHIWPIYMDPMDLTDEDDLIIQKEEERQRPIGTYTVNTQYLIVQPTETPFYCNTLKFAPFKIELK
jgi:hypothetical protein